MYGMETKTKNLLLSIFGGALCGILMALLILYMTMTAGFMIGQLSFWLELAAVCALPLCLGVFRSSGLSVFWARITMILVSFMIMMKYASAMGQGSGIGSQYANISDSVRALSVILHGASLAVAIGALLYAKWKRMRQKVHKQ